MSSPPATLVRPLQTVALTAVIVVLLGSLGTVAASHAAGWFQIDGPCAATGIGYDTRQTGNTANQVSVSLTQVVSVSPGAHSFSLCASSAGPAISVGNRTLVVQTVALAGD